MSSKYTKILILVTLQFFLISGLWAVDIGVSGMLWEEATGYGSQVQGLGFIRDPNSHYHLGLVTIYMVFFVQLSWMVQLILEEGHK